MACFKSVGKGGSCDGSPDGEQPPEQMEQEGDAPAEKGHEQEQGQFKQEICRDQLQQPFQHRVALQPAGVEIAGLRIHRKSQGNIPDRKVSGFGRELQMDIGKSNGMLLCVVRRYG